MIPHCRWSLHALLFTTTLGAASCSSRDIAEADAGGTTDVAGCDDDCQSEADSSTTGECDTDCGPQDPSADDGVPCQVDEDCDELQLCVPSDVSSVCTEVACTQDDHCARDEFCWPGTLSTPSMLAAFPACLTNECEGATVERLALGPATASPPPGTLCVGSDLTAIGTPLLGVAELEAIIAVGGLLTIEDNPELVDLDGLSGIRFLGSVRVRNNPELASVDGLASLERVAGAFHGGRVVVTNNPVLPAASIAVALDGVDVQGEVSICGNLGDDPC